MQSGAENVQATDDGGRMRVQTEDNRQSDIRVHVFGKWMLNIQYEGLGSRKSMEMV